MPDVSVSRTDNKVKIAYNNKANSRFAILPIPYENGWKLCINGQKSDILQANYAFIGLLHEDKIVDIELVYFSSYFLSSLFMRYDLSFLFPHFFIEKGELTEM